MKKKLNKDQSQHLISLGIPPSLASDELIENAWQEHYNEPRPKIFNYFDLRKLLPPELPGEYGRCPLTITYGCDVPGSPHNLWFTYYDDLSEEYICAEEEIDALYELVVWCIKKGYIKTMTDEKF